jgi:hypothetical protein
MVAKGSGFNSWTGNFSGNAWIFPSCERSKRLTNLANFSRNSEKVKTFYTQVFVRELSFRLPFDIFHGLFFAMILVLRYNFQILDELSIISIILYRFMSKSVDFYIRF